MHHGVVSWRHARSLTRTQLVCNERRCEDMWVIGGGFGGLWVVVLGLCVVCLSCCAVEDYLGCDGA